MPGPAHLIYGFALGLIFWKLSSGRFSHRHVFTFGVNCYYGPDIGAVLWYVTRNLLTSDQEQILLLLFHNPYTFPIVLALPLAFGYRAFSRVDIGRVNGWKHIVLNPKPELSLVQCYLLITAGGFSHFLYDFIFDANGQSATFRWVIGTGFWETEAWFDAGIVVVILLVTLLITGYMLINNALHQVPPSKRLVQSSALVIVIAALYVTYLAIRLAIWPELPAVGEEADLGIVIFTAVFLFLPMVLCTAAMHPPDHR